MSDKRMGPLLATLLVAGNMVGSGLYLLPTSLAPVGTSSILAWIVAAGGALAIAGVFAVLGRLRPEADGVLAYPRESLHPAAGFAAWAAYWVSGWAGNVAIALAAIGYLASLFPVLAGLTIVSLLVTIWAFVAVNMLGARSVARFGGATLVVGLIPVAAATVLGLLAFNPDLFAAAWSPGGKALTETLPPAVVLVFWAFLGLESANAVAAKVKNPARDLPIAALAGVGLAAAVYILACLAVQGVIPPGELARSTAPFADVVTRLAGPVAGAIVAGCAALKALGTLAGWILVTAETGRAGAAAGYLPKMLSEADPAVTPRRGLILSGVLMTGAALVTVTPGLGEQFNLLIGFSVALFMLVYGLAAAALIRDARAIADPGRRLATRALAVAALLFSAWVVWVWIQTL
ncbi:MAG TPA: amino acid permease [Caulobacter sp.]|nr:amino acid permease [Caulobacter sp.]